MNAVSIDSDPLSPSDNTTLTMSYDHMGRRREKNAQRFFYDGYLQVADNGGNVYVWDCTEPVATRPLAWTKNGISSYYDFDGNKNVSEVIAADGSVSAHYEYASFGAVIAHRGESAATNPWRFSCEYAEDDTAMVYYNYRHYIPALGCWLTPDPFEECGGINLYAYCCNNALNRWDALGQIGIHFRWDFKDCVSDCMENWHID